MPPLLPLLLLLAGCPWVGPAAWEDRLDFDGDGVPWPEDCDDDDPQVGAAEGFVDADGDGWGGAPATCDDVRAVAVGGDCDDGDPAANPGATEVCGPADDDCDGLIDEEDPDFEPPTWYFDGDGDGVGLEDGAIASCDRPDGTRALAGDCDDDDPYVKPGAVELCNGVDDDCDGVVDEDVEGRPPCTW